MKDFINANKKIGFVILHHCLDDSEVLLNKKIIQDSYTMWSNIAYEKSFLNWGIWDQKIYNDFNKLHYNYSAVDSVQDIHSILFIYYIIKPLIEGRFFNKRLLDIGCGNGIGLKMASQLLQSDYALGIDLTHNLAKHANNNFYSEDKINYLQSDAEHLPLADNSVDIITNTESSHNYPRIEHFFSEVDRVLAPGGYFCYADHHVQRRSQVQTLDLYLKKNPHFKIIMKCDISKMIQTSIYKRLIVNEEWFYNTGMALLGKDSPELHTEMLYLAYSMGLIFLPWWKIRFKRPELRYIAKSARRETFWGKKKYFYYLIQKTSP